MRDFFVLLGEGISKVKIASHMVDSNKVSLDKFSNSIFVDLNMAEAFIQKIGGPVDTGMVVIENGNFIWKEG